MGLPSHSQLVGKQRYLAGRSTIGVSGTTPKAIAETVVIEYTPTDRWTADALQQRSFRGYLRRAHEGRVKEGDGWEEFVNCGCGKTRDAVLRVTSISGGDAIGETTEFVFEPGSD